MNYEEIIENIIKIIQTNGKQLSSNPDVKLTELFDGKVKIPVALSTVLSSTAPSSSASSSLNLKRLRLKTRIGKACLSWSFPTTFSFDQVTSSCPVVFNIIAW